MSLSVKLAVGPQNGVGGLQVMKLWTIWEVCIGAKSFLFNLERKKMFEKVNLILRFWIDDLPACDLASVQIELKSS